MARTISVIIPTLNEAPRLPVLLRCLEAQTRRPDQIVVADAGSADGTADIARAAGATLVAGGMPAQGRNAGAAAATGDLLVFMDADAEPEPTFLASALDELDARGLDAATAPIAAVEDSAEYRVMFAITDAYMRALERLSPHATGLCIIATRALNDAIGGFDETLVLAEDHDYARRAAKAGRFGVLRTVHARTSMRRLQHEGRMRLARVLVYSELRTLAGRPIHSLPFAYDFGAFESRAAGRTAARPAGRRRGRMAMRMLAKPSSELQGDAIGVLEASLLAGGIGAATLASAGADPASYLPVAGAAVVAGASAIEALRKLRFERAYGAYFGSSVATASYDIVDGAGATIVREGVDEIVELHVIGHTGKMGRLSRQGVAGRLQVMVETLEGLRAMTRDMDDPFYANATYVVGRSDLTTLLFKMGFTEVPRPPRYDLINRAEKRLLMWRLGVQVGRKRDGDAEGYRMAVMPVTAFTGPEFGAALDGQIARARRDLARAQAASQRLRVS